MRVLLPFLVTLLTFSSANAQEPAPMHVKEVICSTGQLNTDVTVKPDSFTSAGYIRMLAKKPKSSLLETADKAVLSIVVTGATDSECQNNEKETILTILLDK